MTYTTTQQQEVWLLKHRVWDLFDDGLAAQEVIDALIADGRPPQIAKIFVEKHPSTVAASTHSQESRAEIIESVRAAVQQGDEERILAAMDPACDDDRTLFQMFLALSWQLYGDPPDCKWAAFALSKMHGYGDFALVQALAHENEFNRYVAAFGLGTMRAEASHTIDALRAAVKNDPSELVKSAAAEAIGKIQEAS